MALHGNMMLAPAGGYSGYSIDNSMVLDGSTDYLSRTPGSAGNRKTFVVSFCVRKLKNDSSSTFYTIFSAGSLTASTNTTIYFYQDRLGVYWGGSGGPQWNTTKLFRDNASFYSVVMAFDTTQATFDDRLKVWVNGIQIDAWRNQNSGGLTAQNSDLYINNNQQHCIGADGAALTKGQYQISEFHFIDGTAYEATAFGEFYQGGNQWRAISPSGLTYGTNGFYLPFTQDTPNLGTDYSGNGNDWTENGSPVQSSDSPTVNYATLNPINRGAYGVLSNGNLTTDGTGAGYPSYAATLASSAGKFYAELTVDATGSGNISIVEQGGNTSLSGVNNNYEVRPMRIGDTAAIGYQINNGDYFKQDGDNVKDVLTTTSTTFAVNDVMGIAWNLDDMEFAVYKSGVIVGSVQTIPDGVTALPVWALSINHIHYFDYTMNFGQQDFAYTPPEGHVALSAANLPDPTITDPGEYFNAVTYTGDGTAIGSGGNSITGVGFQSDFTWIKNRDATDSHMLFDVVRGATKVLHSNETAAETTESETLTSFNSDGFTLGNDVEVNTNTEDYVSWNWKAGGAGVTNTDGSISSTVSVNDDAGFSIVSYTGTGSAATVGHGQSEAIEALIVKKTSGTGNWPFYHAGMGATKQLYLNLVNGKATSSTYWNDTEPTASVFSLGTNGDQNGSSADYIAYAFRSIPGFSKVFLYRGNSSADGVFIYTGFMTRWLLLKNADVGHEWFIYDAVRNAYNVWEHYIRPESSVSEYTGGSTRYIDIVSNGIKLRTSNQTMNSSSYDVCAIAFAENPFGGSNIPLGLAR